MEELELRMLQWGIRDGAGAAGDEDDAAESDSSGGGEVIYQLNLPSKGRRSTYSNELKLRVVEKVKAGGKVAAVAASNDVHTRTAVYEWIKNEDRLREACANKKSSKTTLGGQGRHCVFPYADELIQWIKAMRRDDFALKTNHCVAFVKEEYSSWASDYLLTRQEDSLRRAIRRVALSRGFSFRRATKTIISTQELLAEQQRFSAEVGAEIKKAYQRECVFNADETAVYYEEDPGIILAERGQSKSARVKGRRRSDRASVLLTVSAAGKKLKPLVIFRGQPGGTIERDMTAYSNQVLVTVQQSGWMDTRVWNETFINGQWAEFVCDEFPDPLAIYVDNLKCHVSETAQEAFASWGTELVPLPKNTTAVLQPLDVGIMGPFKKKLRSLTLSYNLTSIQRNGSLPLRERLLALKRMSADEKRKLLVDRVVTAWAAIDERCIKRAWEKAGL
ncbi:DDE superfamily endonuclease [Phytophthora infestans]|uniref:DDE superfamily endonuclease n=1 Tax=Phytophthora infestans TaxID=4787 RepID=A0A8S9V8H7_PHYIN|nr:DDE superfamily endonuclease [Phytophthora infestans]